MVFSPMLDLPPPMRLAIRQAEQSNYRYRLGAVVVRGGKTLGRGFNALRGHRYHGYYSWEGTLHAEAAALLNTPLHLISNSTLYVVRINEKGNTLLAKPCDNCFRLMRDLGVKRVIYTTKEMIHEIRV